MEWSRSQAHRAVRVLSSMQLRMHYPAQRAGGEGQAHWRHKAAREKIHLHAAETQNRHDGLSEKQQKPD